MSDFDGCGDNSCLYRRKKGGQGTNGGCICDECPGCGATIRGLERHRDWCPRPEWSRKAKDEAAR